MNNSVILQETTFENNRKDLLDFVRVHVYSIHVETRVEIVRKCDSGVFYGLFRIRSCVQPATCLLPTYKFKSNLNFEGKRREKKASNGSKFR